MTDRDAQLQIDILTKRIAKTQHALATTIDWVAQSSVGVLSFDEAKKLNDILFESLEK